MTKEQMLIKQGLSENQGSNEINEKMGAYLHEWAGLQLGFKQAAVFYMTSAEVPSYRSFFENEGFYSAISDFAYNYGPLGVEKTKTNIGPNSGFSVYVSRDERVAHSMKSLDHSHQFHIPHHSKSSREVFFEISSLLGYPRCCSHFLQSIHDNPKFKKEVAGLGIHYSDETLYPMLALRQGKEIAWQLNNFSEHIPRLISFFVCSYQCKHALTIAKKVHVYWSEQNPSLLASLEQMKRPLLFFSPRKSICFDTISETDGIFSYEGTNPNGHFDEIGLTETLRQANTLTIDEKKIGVYKDSELLFTYHKKNAFDATLINILP